MPVASVNFRRRSDRLWLLGAGLLMALLLLNYWRSPISERLLPDPGLNRKLERAHLALQRGELSRPDGAGAKELFESVLATDPDHTLARQGLTAVREAALARADASLRARRLEEGRRALALAQALSAPLPQLQPLRARLQALEQESVDVPALLAHAAAPELGDEESLALLERVLAIDAGNELALEGRHELHSAWLLQAEHELDAGRNESARVLVERVLASDPAHVELPPLRARLGEIAAREERARARAQAGAPADTQAGPPRPAAQDEAGRSEVNAQRKCFHEAMATGRLRSAQSCLEAWLAQEPASTEAAAAQRLLAERWLALFDERIGASDWSAAEAALANARRWQPLHPQLRAAEARLRRARGTR